MIKIGDVKWFGLKFSKAETFIRFEFVINI